MSAWAALLLAAAAAVPLSAAEPRRVVAQPPAAAAAASVGRRPDPDLPLEKLVLVLAPRDPEGLTRFLAGLEDPASPSFRKWISPAEFGARFGARRPEIETLAAWLSARRLRVEEIPRGATAIVFSGQLRDVESALGTRFLEVELGGSPHLANVTPASLPESVSRPVVGLLPLHDLSRRRPLSRPAPLYNYGFSHRLGPADWTRLYDVDPLLAGALDGTGRSVAVIGRTNIDLNDIRSFRSFFGLPAKDPVVVLNGTDPGILGGGESLEASLDVEWAGAVASAADVRLVVSKTTATTDGVDLSTIYAVDNDVGDVVSLSFGDCEADMDAASLALYANLWAQAAAQGMSVFVASGDSGAAGCDSSNATTGTVAAVNGLGSQAQATCAGGSQLDDTASPSTWWESTNDPVTRRSIKSYVPEVAWNESGSAGGYGLLATGGGYSTVYGRPAWQSAPGLKDGTARAVPDVSVSAAGHNAYSIVVNGTSLGVSGTSAAAPSLASLTAIFVQRVGARLGNLNPRLWSLGRTQYLSAGAAVVFHDVVSGSNSVPGVTGFDAGAGFDAATGLGTPDAALLADGLAGQALHGDANADGTLDVKDVFWLIAYLFAGGPDPLGPCDANGDGAVNVQDVFYLVDYLFAGGTAPL
jgi:subtilase family serine protease